MIERNMLGFVSEVCEKCNANVMLVMKQNDDSSLIATCPICSERKMLATGNTIYLIPLAAFLPETFTGRKMFYDSHGPVSDGFKG